MEQFRGQSADDRLLAEAGGHFERGIAIGEPVIDRGSLFVSDQLVEDDDFGHGGEQGIEAPGEEVGLFGLLLGHAPAGVRLEDGGIQIADHPGKDGFQAAGLAPEPAGGGQVSVAGGDGFGIVHQGADGAGDKHEDEGGEQDHADGQDHAGDGENVPAEAGDSGLNVVNIGAGADHPAPGSEQFNIAFFWKILLGGSLGGRPWPGVGHIAIAAVVGHLGEGLQEIFVSSGKIHSSAAGSELHAAGMAEAFMVGGFPFEFGKDGVKDQAGKWEGRIVEPEIALIPVADLLNAKNGPALGLGKGEIPDQGALVVVQEQGMNRFHQVFQAFLTVLEQFAFEGGQVHQQQGAEEECGDQQQNEQHFDRKRSIQQEAEHGPPGLDGTHIWDEA